MKRVILFPGQGAQAEGMGVSLAENFETAKKVFDTAGSVLGFDLLDICRNASKEELSKTVISQPGIMAVSLAAALVLREKGIECEAAAGHSLGEYPAMVYSGIVSIEDGFKLIKARSEAMQKAADSSDGVMYAVMKLSEAEIEEVCGSVEGYVVPANYNSTGQTVIAGEAEAAEKAAEILKEKGARVVKLAVSSAFHTKLMKPAADEFLDTAKTVSYSQPKLTMLSNITGEPVIVDDTFAERLAAHIISPVRFTKELSWMNDNCFETFIECGPGKVLTGLAKKTLDGITAYNISTAEDLDNILPLLTAG